MSRFSSLFDALSDKKARFFSEKQIINDMIYDYYYSNNKSSFDAVVLSGGADGDATQNVSIGNDQVIALKVRPVDIQGLALPDPCSEACQETSQAYKAFLMAMHPTAYSLPTEAGTVDRPSNGQTVECYFEEPDKYRRLRWRAITDTNPGHYNQKCSNLPAGLLAAFEDGTATTLDVPDDDPRLQAQQRTGRYNGIPIRNGQIKGPRLSDLENIDGQGQLLTPAAKEFNEMAKEFFNDKGYKLRVNSSYRTIADQRRLKRKELSGGGNPAAIPGRSNHGWGLAVDINTEDKQGKTKFQSEIFQWLTQNARRFNFIHPEWACESCAKAEAHHWEYKGSIGLEIDE